MEYKKNENGLTLVELLASIVIIAIISLALWNLFFNSMNHNSREVSKNQLQQEANLIINTIQNLHTKYKITNLEIDPTNSSLTISYRDKDSISNQNTIFNNNNIKYEIKTSESFTETQTPQHFEFYLKLTSTKNENIKFEVRTTFSKLE